MLRIVSAEADRLPSHAQGKGTPLRKGKNASKGGSGKDLKVALPPPLDAGLDGALKVRAGPVHCDAPCRAVGVRADHRLARSMHMLCLSVVWSIPSGSCRPCSEHFSMLQNCILFLIDTSLP